MNQRVQSSQEGMGVQIREANQMVEEMMLLANVTVAERILAAFPSCSLLRSHATPAPQRFQPLVQAGVAAGFDIDFSSSKVCYKPWPPAHTGRLPC